jgi:hypothetical protein
VRLICFSIFALGLQFSIALSGQFKGIAVSMGTFSISGEYATQVITVTNSTGRHLKSVKVECGFFDETKIVASSDAFIENLDVEEDGYAEVVATNAFTATSAKCRTVSVE